MVKVSIVFFFSFTARNVYTNRVLSLMLSQWTKEGMGNVLHADAVKGIRSLQLNFKNISARFSYLYPLWFCISENKLNPTKNMFGL